MTKNPIDQCQNPTQELTVKIPCALAERVNAYATETGNTLEMVVIEALDYFVRIKKTPSTRIAHRS